MSDAKYVIKSSYAVVDTNDGDGVDDGDEEDEPGFLVIKNCVKNSKKISDRQKSNLHNNTVEKSN